MVVETGNMFAITLEAFRLMPQRPVPWRDFIRQSWFIASVSMFPAVLVSIARSAPRSLSRSETSPVNWGPNRRPAPPWSWPSCARPLLSWPLC